MNLRLAFCAEIEAMQERLEVANRMLTERGATIHRLEREKDVGGGVMLKQLKQKLALGKDKIAELEQLRRTEEAAKRRLEEELRAAKARIAELSSIAELEGGNNDEGDDDEEEGKGPKHFFF